MDTLELKTTLTWFSESHFFKDDNRDNYILKLPNGSAVGYIVRTHATSATYEAKVLGIETGSWKHRHIGRFGTIAEAEKAVEEAVTTFFCQKKKEEQDE